MNSLCRLWLGCSVFYFHLHIEVLCLEVSSLTHTLIGPNRRKSYLRTGSPRWAPSWQRRRRRQRTSARSRTSRRWWWSTWRVSYCYWHRFVCKNRETFTRKDTKQAGKINEKCQPGSVDAALKWTVLTASGRISFSVRVEQHIGQIQDIQYDFLAKQRIWLPLVVSGCQQLGVGGLSLSVTSSL